MAVHNSLRSSFRGAPKARARNPYSRSWLWIPGSRAPRNDEWRKFPPLTLNSFVARPDMYSRSRDMRCPSDAEYFRPLQNRGRREGRVQAAPMVACKKARGRHHRLGRNNRPSLRDGLLGLYVLSPGTGVLAPVARVLVKASRAWPQHREARTTRFRRPRSCRSSACETHAATRRVHRISGPTFVTIAKRPSWPSRDGQKCGPDLPDGARSNYAPCATN